MNLWLRICGVAAMGTALAGIGVGAATGDWGATSAGGVWILVSRMWFDDIDG